MSLPVVRAYTARFSGALTASALDRLREVAGLQARGRLDDDRSEEFGVRRLRDTPGTPVLLRLYREDARWSFILTYQGDPPAAGEVAAVRDRVRAAVAAAGVVLDHES